MLKISFVSGISKKVLSQSNHLLNDHLIEGMHLKIPKAKLKKDELEVIKDLGINKQGIINNRERSESIDGLVGPSKRN